MSRLTYTSPTLDRVLLAIESGHLDHWLDCLENDFEALATAVLEGTPSTWRYRAVASANTQPVRLLNKLHDEIGRGEHEHHEDDVTTEIALAIKRRMREAVTMKWAVHFTVGSDEAFVGATRTCDATSKQAAMRITSELLDRAGVEHKITTAVRA